MRKFSNDELNRIPELKHLEVHRAVLGGYEGSIFEYRHKIALGETTIAGLTQDESIAAVDQATQIRIAAMEAFIDESMRAQNRHSGKVLGITAVVVVLMVALLLLTFFVSSSSQGDTPPSFQYVQNIALHLAAMIIPVVAILGAIYSMCRPR